MSNKDFFTACAVPWFLKKTDDIEQQINNQLQYLLKDSTNVVWRTQGVENGLVRWDDRHPDIVFKDGFVPRANPPQGQLRYGIVDLWRYVVYHDLAIFVSTTRTQRVGTAVERWAPNNLTSLFEYTIHVYGGIEVNATLGDHKFVHQDEISFPGGIRREFIYSARQYDATGKVVRVWINRQFDLLANGRYEVPLFRLPDILNWSVGVQITHWLAPGKYEYYHKLPSDLSVQELSISDEPEPMHRPGSVQAVDTSSEATYSEPMWGPGKETKGPFLSRSPIRACLPTALYGSPKEAWFFTDDQCARFSIDGTDKLLTKPLNIANQWKSLKDLGFSTVDAFLPFKGGAFVFSKDKYGRIAIDNKLKDSKVSGPSAIEDGWKSLVDSGLRRVDAALAHPTKPGEAWIFHGRLCVQIRFSETSNSLVAGPFVIADKWPASLKAAGFDTVETVLPTSNANEAWFFKGTRNVLIDVTNDKVKKEVNSAAHVWLSLVEAKMY
ncbi:hypothetical protein H0H92_007506 [Tricholoma furcatifolium]|nr:hypothetical protein H0H92_007506 [Tricholoma furcatifolium]